MSIKDALYNEIGNIGEGDSLLLHALACLVVYSLKGKKSKMKQDISGKDYDINDAFYDSIYLRKKPVHKAPIMIPSPS